MEVEVQAIGPSPLWTVLVAPDLVWREATQIQHCAEPIQLSRLFDDAVGNGFEPCVLVAL